ncbi:FapA family protein [Vibrio rhizosphaerae]|uniref:FapA family protein n=1 Tax=Vibrio rhizosphaerae TaxID=398736 RepID=A0ABU4J1L0_9VIBR|nr:FapA family protein [Vibrio rhizosphaerae]MDW6094549.1 FapA family protein [Vibrio rhizosphaerae]
MWKRILSITEDKKSVIANLKPIETLSKKLSKSGIMEALANLGASEFYLDQDVLERFINDANEGKGEAYQDCVVAKRLHAQVRVDLAEQDMLASMVVTGAYGGRGLLGSDLVHALAQSKVTKGINKTALKKVLIVSRTLSPGEIFVQPIAQGKNPINGVDTKFIPLVDDVTKRVLAPQQKENSSKLDMRNLGETITVGEGDQVMRRIPATKGTPGYTVQGKVIPAKPGNDSPMKEGKGTAISEKDPNILVATISGMPLIKDRSIDVDNALCMQNINVGTGHVKFKGALIVAGNIESGMIVRATGSITVGGFIESADVQAQGDIQVGKGIIGHTTNDDEKRTCVVKSGATIKANYAQYSELQAHDDIHLTVHSISNNIRCGQDLYIIDEKEKQGTLSGGMTKVGGKLVCVNLGVEGDTATRVEAFGCYASYRERLEQYKEQYKQTQAKTMDIVRRELEFNKKPKEERTEEGRAAIERLKQETSEQMNKEKEMLAVLEDEFEDMLRENTIEVKSKVFSHVTVQFGDERIVIKRSHGPSIFNFTQYEIKCRSLLDENDVVSEI